MNFEEVIKIILPMTILLTPLFATMFSIHSRLARIEQRLDLDKERIEESLTRHDRHIHEIRNSLQFISILLAKRGIYEEEKEHIKHHD
jgi:hypothetical protein